MTTIFAILVVLGFIFHFLSTFSKAGPYMPCLAWGCWLGASLIWALTGVGPA